MAQNFVQSKLSASKVTMFEKISCPFCVRAKGILQKYKFKEGHLEIVNIATLDIMSGLQDYFLKITGERSGSSHRLKETSALRNRERLCSTAKLNHIGTSDIHRRKNALEVVLTLYH
ncbi:unnamed protein product [Ranitomeya imitator]|uniref:Glutaredoxin-1 n=1 Tax=Ranitomeya imitator TaxID=111125 RepID=A0ABN9LFT4_9NEOB|nr:unnamed protein product [Ranitomeya imitator]